MATIADWVKIDANRVAQNLNEVTQKLVAAEGEIVIDFSAVPKVDAAALAALENLTNEATNTKVKLVLKGVSIDVYKVFKLANLTRHFSCVG